MAAVHISLVALLPPALCEYHVGKAGDFKQDGEHIRVTVVADAQPEIGNPGDI